MLCAPRSSVILCCVLPRRCHRHTRDLRPCYRIYIYMGSTILVLQRTRVRTEIPPHFPSLSSRQRNGYGSPTTRRVLVIEGSSQPLQEWCSVLRSPGDVIGISSGLSRKRNCGSENIVELCTELYVMAMELMRKLQQHTNRVPRCPYIFAVLPCRKRS